MKISAIIPTYNRVFDLSECLNSVLDQAYLPAEVLIIDNSTQYRQEIHALADEFAPRFRDKGIRLEYIFNDKGNSLTVAKNTGADKASADLISFLDDDVVLEKDYYQKIIEVFETHPRALGVEGKVRLNQKNKGFVFSVAQFLGKVFRLGFLEERHCRVLASLGVTYSLTDEVINCQWLSGASTFRKDLFREFRYDEKLKKYCDGEDLDFSYRVYKKHPDSLFLAPGALYLHKAADTARAPTKERVYMKEVYYHYLFYKLMENKIRNKIAFFWSHVGEIIFKFISVITLKVRTSELVYLLGAYIFCAMHKKEIKEAKLDFFNAKFA